MQRGSLAMVIRKEGPAVWQFRWSEKGLCGARVQRKRVIGSIERYPNETAARSAVTVLLTEINSEKARVRARSITVAQLCDHFEQRELARDNTWRSYSTKKTYQAYLTRWVLPHWRRYELAEVRTIQVESWLRGLPLAKSSCAKIRNLMSVLFNHACRYELFDRNPICLVRQSAKRTPPIAPVHRILDLASTIQPYFFFAALTFAQRAFAAARMRAMPAREIRRLG